MTGADESGTIERWKGLAEAEPDDRRRSNFGGLALVFADAAGRYDLWFQALEGWNMKRSRAVLEWLEEGRQEGLQKGEQVGLQKGQALGARLGQLEFLEATLTSKFGELPADSLDRLRALSEERLKAMPGLLFSSATLADLGL